MYLLLVSVSRRRRPCIAFRQSAATNKDHHEREHLHGKVCASFLPSSSLNPNLAQAVRCPPAALSRFGNGLLRSLSDRWVVFAFRIESLLPTSVVGRIFISTESEPVDESISKGAFSQ